MQLLVDNVGGVNGGFLNILGGLDGFVLNNSSDFDGLVLDDGGGVLDLLRNSEAS
jgi:hypothetical protein